ncbi:glycoside hydrolase family 92 protein [Stakelama sp. CBK3Z-3]|uniref:Glycoside hydrolase family 92 protein n=1 Tax=Stakelama flava TaxID=2860338 RepID=A0ABS6XQT4_9SPHN|nr:glycoside hydrolase domain-containing protein [Stakelama flava]MBW4332158.1 glycoside hydrolase family 92 protein [Stakelama flava]
MITALLALAALSSVQPAPVGPAAPPADLVDPFVGTMGDSGQLTPAANVPFGMVQLGPDTEPHNHNGYAFSAPVLLGFSHTRAIGVGCGGAGGDLMISLDYAGAPAAAPILEASQRARAGRYSVRYGDDIAAEMTATRGAGLLRFTVPKAGQVLLRIDGGHSYTTRHATRWLTSGANDVRAQLSAGTVCDQGIYTIYTASRVTRNGHPLDGALTAQGAGVMALPITVAAGDVIEVRTGLSSVDSDGAALVRDAELGDRSFDSVAAAARDAWNEALGRVAVAGPWQQRALFYTSLFRVFATPVAIDDPDRRHRESDGRIAKSAPGTTRYASWSLWDNYRTQLPLLALLQPECSADIARSLVALYAAGKPQWASAHEPFITVRTEHAGIALLDMRRKGIDGFDAQAALRGMIADSDRLERSTPDQQIEAAYDDWATGQLAGDLGDTDLAARFLDRAHGYRAMWRRVFEPLGADADVVKAHGLYQGTLWQYRWAPVFDLPWIEATLGRDKMLAQLNHFFDANLFNMTNEPDIQVPWFFATLGRPQPTADLVRTILTQPIAHPYVNSRKRTQPFIGPSFALSPEGFADGMDDDAGAMTSWYVFASLGLYPLVPGEPWYVVTTPAFRHARVQIAPGRALTIKRSGPADGRVVSASFNGQPLRDFRLIHQQLVAGGTLIVRTEPTTAVD